MIEIYRKEHWIINPNDKVVNSIMKRIEKNNGECPCSNPGETREDRLCPCKEYRENDCCHCGLYLKKLTKFRLPNRMGMAISLVERPNGLFALEGDDVGYTRIIGNSPNIEAIDPAGGPLLEVGKTVGRYTIESITQNSGEFLFKLVYDHK